MIQRNMFKKLGVAVSALMMIGALSACGDDAPESTCKSTQVAVGAGSSIPEGCYDPCTTDMSCGAGRYCRSFPGQKLCFEGTNPNTNNMTMCASDQKRVSYRGMDQCLKDCGADASVCGAMEECTSIGADRVCTPKEAMTGCPDGEVEAVYAGGTRQCYKTCTADTDCAAASRVCRGDDAGRAMICVPPTQTDQLCASYCSTIYGACLDTNCAGLTPAQKQALVFNEQTCLNGIPNAPVPEFQQPCSQRLNGQGQFAPLERLLAEASAGGCNSPVVKLRQAYLLLAINGQTIGPADHEAACGVVVPPLNKACETAQDCMSSPVQSSCDDTTKTCDAGACQPALSAAERMMIMGPTLTEGDFAGCGEQTFCILIPQNGGIASQCVEQCATNADCAFGVTGDADSGSACAAIPVQGGNPVGFCEPACATDADCPTVMSQGQMIERVCSETRTCVRKCDPDAMMACTSGTCKEGKTAGSFGCHLTVPPLMN